MRSAGKRESKGEGRKMHFQNMIGARALNTMTDLEWKPVVTKEKALLKSAFDLK